MLWAKCCFVSSIFAMQGTLIQWGSDYLPTCWQQIQLVVSVWLRCICILSSDRWMAKICPVLNRICAWAVINFYLFDSICAAGVRFLVRFSHIAISGRHKNPFHAVEFSYNLYHKKKQNNHSKPKQRTLTHFRAHSFLLFALVVWSYCCYGCLYLGM